MAKQLLYLFAGLEIGKAYPTWIQVQKLWFLRIHIDSFDLILIAYFFNIIFECILFESDDLM